MVRPTGVGVHARPAPDGLESAQDFDVLRGVGLAHLLTVRVLASERRADSSSAARTWHPPDSAASRGGHACGAIMARAVGGMDAADGAYRDVFTASPRRDRAACVPEKQASHEIARERVTHLAGSGLDLVPVPLVIDADADRRAALDIGDHSRRRARSAGSAPTRSSPRSRARGPRRRSRTRGRDRRTCTQQRSSMPLSRASAARRSSGSGNSTSSVAFQFDPSGISGL